MKAGIRIGAALACALAALAIAATTAGADPARGGWGERRKSGCPLSVSEQRNLGASYVYTLKVKGSSCAKGKKLVLKFHECRHDNGGADGTCRLGQGLQLQHEDPRRVAGAVSAKATCTKGSKKFKQTFAENT